MENNKISQYHDKLFTHFGYNFSFVADLLDKYFLNRTNVSEFWQKYFDTLTNNISSPPPRIYNLPPKQDTYNIETNFAISVNDQIKPIFGASAKLIENMNKSLSIPTAISLRTIPVKLLEENRNIINKHLISVGQSKLSFTHFVAYAIVKSLISFPDLNNSFALNNNKPVVIIKNDINIGIAVDLVKKDGSRTLIVPNIKGAQKLNFKQFVDEFNLLIEKARNNKIEPADFQNTTISITNPGGLGTVSSSPRLMTGQGCIIAIGSIDYPSEFKAMDVSGFAAFGIGKIMNITNTYDHRIIQGAESGEYLREIDKLLMGNYDFYDNIFKDLEIPQKPAEWGINSLSQAHKTIRDVERIEKQVRLFQLINMYRVRGHLLANLNPLKYSPKSTEELDPSFYGFTIWDYDRYFFTDNIFGLESGTLREILDLLHQTYCQKIGVEYMHIQNPKEKVWLQIKMEAVKNVITFTAEQKIRILNILIISETFEHFLHTKFIGHKRFSLEGSETIIPLLDYLLILASNENIKEVFIGTAHRGRLNILSNIIGKPYNKIFSEFEDNLDPDSPQGTGDVKYHLGATGIYNTIDDKKIKVSLASNPSHLEFVNPVVEGITRAKLSWADNSVNEQVIPVLIHGDAAFAGQGIVAETLNLSQLEGYSTGGTIHIIINNQIGFTTMPEEARSSPYATDAAKMIQAPIFHVNGDDPESALWVTKLAFEYRQQFKKDVVIDLIGYRRHGHNEGDDPVFTQPLMYKTIKSHLSVKTIYNEKLFSQKIILQNHTKEYETEIINKLENSLDSTKPDKIDFQIDKPLAYNKNYYDNFIRPKHTSVNFTVLSDIVKTITTLPDNFVLNPKLKKHMAKMKEFLTGRAVIDWAFSESLAIGSLLNEGFSIRLSGQDSARGTFSQRHLILTDYNTGMEIFPHKQLASANSKIEALDSLLSESAVLGFEYGYSIADPLTLVMWEAQFGDFANGAQVIIDNFIVSSKTKWNLPSNIVLLLPHGQEGQGPEHSSARIERFLILCAQNNMYVCNPTTPAQYFHLLRRQMVEAEEIPLVIFTPKSLLRLPAARSLTTEFTSGQFNTVIDDLFITNKDNIQKVILTSGKVYYDLLKYKEFNNIVDTAIIRIEQYYPYPSQLIKDYLSDYKNAKIVYWVQEEPQNMGAWSFLQNRLINDLSKWQLLTYIGRIESPSPASGSSKHYLFTQEELIKNAFK
ncbi:MAG: multifunctional oxoglutarate decarboxylase/oxoglutarate dehydrogenase thiamine pyrophosphate-binding subunit/dihydrolipoyllysine-residue succinyltransferase subunit [bacterium]